MTWELLIAYGVGGVLGSALAWFSRGETIRFLREQLEGARAAEALATDRLVHAWKDGAQIPPRPGEKPAVPLQPLPADLKAHVEQWDDAEHRAMLESDIRAMLGRGLSPVAVLMALDNQHPS